jgi:hypothetical protein
MSLSSRLPLTLLIIALGSSCAQRARSAGPVQPDWFALQPPADLSRLDKKPVWFTDYIDYLVDEDVGATALPLVNIRGQSLNVSLSHTEWCKAANEGTVTVLLTTHATKSFNFAGRVSRPITDCSDVFKRYTHKEIEAINRSAFSELPPDAPFGLGKGNYRLVPNRSIAVDLKGTKFNIGDVLYVPKLKGMAVALPDGRTVSHDGYVMAVDKVSACSGAVDMPADCNTNHLDYFRGRSRSDTLPAPLSSSPRQPLDAYVITDPAIIATLKAEHLRD